jgi:HK97 family phage portal protein
MGFLSRAVSERKATQLTYDQIAGLIDGTTGGRIAGVTVTEKTALQVSTVLACVKAIADGCATPTLEVFREKADGRREKADNIPEYRLLARRANEWQTSFEWRRLMTVHAALTGAGLSIKVRGDNRRVKELIPIQPGNWDVRKVSRYEVRYRCWDEFGMVGEFQPDDVFVLQGVQWDWMNSLNAVMLARAAVGLAIATEHSQASMHENGLRNSGVYSVDGNLTLEQHERLTKWIAGKTGPEKAGAPLVIDRAAKWISTAMSGVDSQHLETRRFQVEEICRGYGVFPIMVGHSDKAATFASTESFFGAHVKHTLAPWHKAWTQRLDEMLLDGAGPLFAEFDVRYLLSGSLKDRAQWARTMAEMGIYTRNEIRDEEGKDPLPGLDEPLTPLNMNSGKKDPANAPATEDTPDA